jgi:protein-arginine deiminase
MRWSALLILAVGCGDGLEVTLEAAPGEGVAPLLVSLTAKAIAKDGATVRYRFDLDGDGAFDTEPGETASIEHEYLEGSHRPRVEATIEGSDPAIATAQIDVRPNGLPAPKLDASPLMGRQPLLVTLDASGTIDPEGDSMEARLDFEGDGEFDTEFAPLGPVMHSYSVKGTFTPQVEVRDARGGTAIGSGPPLTILPGVDLDVDVDRDGRITDADDAGEDAFSIAGGAVFLTNADDDDGDGRQDWRDAVVSGMEDLADLARVLIPQYVDLPADALVTLSSGAASERVRIFSEGNGGVVELMAPGQSEVGLDATALAAGDLVLYVEGLSPRQPEWDGTLELTLTIERAGEATEIDSVVMRVSPVIFPDNMQPAQILYVMRITEPGYGRNVEFLEAVDATLPAGVELYDVSQYEYVADRWVQDNMQTGYQIMPSEGGQHVMQTYLETVRSTGPEGLEYFVTRERIGADYGFVFTGGGETSLNYGGNLEITPPYEANGVDHPFGSVLVGGGNGGTLLGRAYEDHMNPEQRAFLDAQIQGPTIEVASEWLYVGHLDEFIQFVPNPNRTNGKDWILVLSSPALAVASLERMESEGMGAAPVFAGRQTATTESAILDDARLMSYQEAAQAKLDTIRDQLIREMGLGDNDIVEVPVLYEPIVFFGDDYAVAYNPGIQNLVTVRDLLLVPDPEGPDDQNGNDIWQNMTRDVLDPLGVQLVFVDIFDSYHLNFGEAHCGTEVEHAPYQQLWWEKE